MHPLFDRYITVDWSASSSPKTGKDSIWICSLGPEGEPSTENPSTRTAAERAVRHHLAGALQRRERVLIGFDFPYAYPRGFPAALGLPGEPWRAVWAELERLIIEDSPWPNSSNRFAVASELNSRLVDHAYWGRPQHQHHEHLSMRRDVVRYRKERRRAFRNGVTSIAASGAVTSICSRPGSFSAPDPLAARRSPGFRWSQGSAVTPRFVPSAASGPSRCSSQTAAQESQRSFMPRSGRASSRCLRSTARCEIRRR